ncbi:MAG: FAD-dependent oxidoreductase [Dehalococcoidia bacterium]
MSDNKFEKVLEPGYIGPVKTRNRILKSAAGMLLWHENDLHMREEVKAYYERFARGGVGLIIVESVTVDYPKGARYRNRYRLDDDKYIEGLKELVEVIHKHNCPTFLNFNHDGPWQVHWGPHANDPLYEGPPIAASPTYLPGFSRDHHNEKPRVLSIPEIEDIVDKFANSAERAKKAGFDGIDINAGSSHLFHNFLSPFWNKREDIYGGSLENRSRLLVQVIEEIKRRLGKEFPISIIINGIEMGQAIGVDNSACLTPEESRRAAALFEQAGADAVQVRSHWLGWHVGSFIPDAFFHPDPPVPINEMPKEYNAKGRGAGVNIFLAAGMKKALSIPVTVVGRMDWELGEKAIRDGSADFIAMTRRLHADPEFPNKLAGGRVKDIAPCTACGSCLGSSARCRINGLSGTTHISLGEANKRKKVLVIGGGPAGMEAARASAVRGHKVSLYEKLPRLGGLLPIAAVVKGNSPENLPLLVDYFERQLKNLDVDVHLGKEADLSTVESERPDVVFVAAGGAYAPSPDIPGIERKKVVSSSDLHRRLKFFLRFFSPGVLRWLTKFYIPVGKKVVIIGSGYHACELAEFLTKRGRKVTIVAKEETIGLDLAHPMAEHLFPWFERNGVSLITGVKEYEQITEEGLIIIDSEGERRTLEDDSIIPAFPLMPNTEMIDVLQGKVPEVYALGDCKSPSIIMDAVGDGTLSAIGI